MVNRVNQVLSLSVIVLPGRCSQTSPTEKSSKYLPYSLSAQGQHEEGIRSCEKAFRLSPRDPLEYLFFNCLGAAQLHAKKYADAKATLERSLEIIPDMTWALISLASVCVRLGRLGEATEALGRAAAISDTAIPFLFRVRPKLFNWHEYTDPIREIYNGPLLEPTRR